MDKFVDSNTLQVCGIVYGLISLAVTTYFMKVNEKRLSQGYANTVRNWQMLLAGVCWPLLPVYREVRKYRQKQLAMKSAEDFKLKRDADVEKLRPCNGRVID